MASFFDLKEDGTLDVLLEYVAAEDKEKKNKPTTIDFIRYSDGGDTTFLKVEVFSSSCPPGCGSEKIKIGEQYGQKTSTRTTKKRIIHLRVTVIRQF